MWRFTFVIAFGIEILGVLSVPDLVDILPHACGPTRPEASRRCEEASRLDLFRTSARQYTDLLARALVGATGLFANVKLFYSNFVELQQQDRNAGVLINDGFTRCMDLRVKIEDVLWNCVPGDVVECGVWRGGIPLFVVGALQAYQADPTRLVWLADSFEGLPAFDTGRRWQADSGFERGSDGQQALQVSLSDVQEHFKQYGLDLPNIRVLKGYFSETLPTAPISQIAILRVDGDLYSSTYQILEYLYPKVVIGGYVLLDDWILPQSRRAALDYRRQHNVTDPIRKDSTRSFPTMFWQRMK